jgi:alpha-glucosidase
LPEVTDLPDEVREEPAFAHSGASRDGCRVPLPWSGTVAPYGFCEDGVPTWLPQPAGWGELTAAAQIGDPASTVELYRSALRLRREHPALGAGTLRWLAAPSEHALAFARDPRLACVVNLGPASVSIDGHGEPLLASTALPGDGTLPPDSAVWLTR